ncbi:MAG: DUF429 domain-containing protein [Candidatus Bathyarchaeia archaeon]
MKDEIITGIDLAGKEENPTGFAIWKQGTVETCLIYTDKEILDKILHVKPVIVAIDAPLKLPKKGALRKADKELIQKGYRVFPPGLSAMKALTLRAERLNKLIMEKGLKTIEVHPTSTRKALSIPTKDWNIIQEIFKRIGLKGSIKMRTLTSHELDAVTAALTAYLHIQGQTETVGDQDDGFIVIPKKRCWWEIKL